MSDKIYTEAMLVGEPHINNDGVPTFTFRITSEIMDRQGEIVTLDGWNFESYMKNPVVLNSHQYNDIQAIVGRCISITRDNDGWNAELRFNDTDAGQLARTLVEGGDLRAVSVGFKPVLIDYPSNGTMRRMRGQDAGSTKALVSMVPEATSAVKHVAKELLEISVVPIPANANAVRLRSFSGAQTKNGAADFIEYSTEDWVSDFSEKIDNIVPVEQMVDVPKWMQSNAKRGLRWHEGGYSGVSVAHGVVEDAKCIAAGKISVRKLNQVSNWFKRNMSIFEEEDAHPGSENYPSVGVVTAAMMGGGTEYQSSRAMAWARTELENRQSFFRKGAVPVHSTPINSDRSTVWDGQGIMSDVDDFDVLAKICAWVDENEPEVKRSYKLPHHEPNAPYRVVWRGLTASMAALNGARAEMNVPDEDRQAIYEHLAAHYRQFDAEAPELKFAAGGHVPFVANGSDSHYLLEKIWPEVATAMHAVLSDHLADDTVRKYLYDVLSGAYKVASKEVPDFEPVETIAKFNDRDIQGMFWESEPMIVQQKAGRVLSARNEGKLREAISILSDILAAMQGSGSQGVPGDDYPVAYGSNDMMAGYKSAYQISTTNAEAEQPTVSVKEIAEAFQEMMRLENQTAKSENEYTRAFVREVDGRHWDRDPSAPMLDDKSQDIILAEFTSWLEKN